MKKIAIEVFTALYDSEACWDQYDSQVATKTMMECKLEKRQVLGTVNITTKL